MRRLARFFHRLLRRVLVTLLVVWTGAYFFFNDETLGAFVSYQVTNSVRGTFRLRRIHYPFVGGLWSALTDRTTRVAGEDFVMLDPDGNLAMRVDGVEVDVKLRTLLFSLAEVPFRGKLVLTLLLSNAKAPRALAIVAPTRSSWGKTPTEINIPATMTGKGPPGEGSDITIRVDGIDIDAVDFGIGFSGSDGRASWSAALNNAKAHASLIYKSGRDYDTKDGPYLYFELGPVIAPSGNLQIGETFSFPLEQITVAQFGSQLPARGNLAFSAVARSRGGRATIGGALQNVFSAIGGVKLDLFATNGNGLLRTLPQPIGRWLHGPATARLRINGPFSKVAFDGEVAGALANVEGLVVKHVASGFHYECGRIELPHIVGEAATGRVWGSVRVQLSAPPPPVPNHKKKKGPKELRPRDDSGCPVGGKPQWHADLKLDAVDPEHVPWVPRSVASDVAGKLSGALKLWGNLVDHPEIIHVEEIDAVLERRVAKLLPRRLKLGGGFRFTPSLVRLDDLSASAEGLRVAVLGEINPKTLDVQGRTRIDGTADGTWVRRLWSDSSLRTGRLSSSGRLSGQLDRPAIELDVELFDWMYSGRKLESLSARLRLLDGELAIDQVRGRLYGGLLSGDLVVHLFADGYIRRLLAAPPLRFGIGLTGAEAQGLLGSGAIRGKVDFDMRLNGTVQSPFGAAEASIRGLSIFGDPYSLARVRAELQEGVSKLRDLEIVRQQGGALSGSADIGPGDKLQSTIVLAPTPLGAIPGVSKLPFALLGVVSAAVSLQGSMADPLIAGTITIGETTLRKVGLGKGQLELAPASGKVVVRGRIFDRLHIDGEVRLSPLLGAHFVISFTDMALEGLVPELQALASTRGLVSGKLVCDYEALNQDLSLQLVLDKLALVVEGQTEDEPSRVLLVRNQGEIRLHSDGAQLFVDQVELESVLGSVKLSGVVDEQATDLLVRGRLGLELVQYFVRGLFNHVSGDAEVDLRLQGPMRRPRFFGTLDVARVAVEPRGLEQQIKIPSGHAQFTGDHVAIDRLRVVLDQQEANVSGQVQLAGLEVKELGLRVEGKLAGKLLTWALPEQVGDARGALGVDVQISGTPLRPQLRGRAEFIDLVLELRKLDRELRIKDGTAHFSPDGKVVIGCPKTGSSPERCRQVTGLFDGESAFFADGGFLWDGLELSGVDVTGELRGYNHSSEEYQVSFSPRLRLRSVGRGLELSGRIDVIEGRYSRQYEILRDAVIRPRVVEKSVPFWTGIPLLEEMRLQLSVQSTPGTLIVKNNLAELALSAYLDISGTLADPRLDGAIQLEEGGTFKLPTLRAEFVTSRGQVTFDANKRFPDETPRIDLSATAEMLDRGDVAHTILAKLTGTLQKPQLQFISQEGWDQSTTLAFLLAGRTPDDIRRTLGTGDPTVRISGAASASGADGLTKSASGVVLSNVISDPLKRTIGLDIASIEVGTRSVDIRLCKRFGRWIKMCGTGEIGFLGSSRLDARGELRLADSLLLMLRVEYLTRGVETLQEVQSRLKFELNYRFPLGY